MTYLVLSDGPPLLDGCSLFFLIFAFKVISSDVNIA